MDLCLGLYKTKPKTVSLASVAGNEARLLE